MHLGENTINQNDENLMYIKEAFNELKNLEHLDLRLEFFNLGENENNFNHLIQSL